MRRFLALVASVLLAAMLASAPPASGASEPPAAPGQLLVGYERGATPSQRAAARERAGARLLERVVRGTADRSEVELVQLPTGADRGRAERRFEADRSVRYAEPNWLLTHDGNDADDPYYTDGRLWGAYGDATVPKQNPFGSQAGEAWTGGNVGSGTVYVGVIDEGIDVSHPDLDANIWVNPADPVDGVDNDANGYVDDVHGWDFHNNDSSVYDGGNSDKHGTHVAGTIGAERNNGAGVVGVAPKVTMISGKFLGPNGGYLSNAVKAVNYFTDLKTRHGMNIVATSNSWGGGGFSQALLDAIVNGAKQGILFVAAAGNDGTNNDTTARYPSNYDTTLGAGYDAVVAVAAIDSGGALASWSNYGATTVDLGAPGVGVYSTLPKSSYGSYSGTSMATPHVTGAVVLRAAAFPTESAAQRKAAVLTAAVATPSLLDKTLTDGRLDAGGFFVTDTTPPAAPTGLLATDTKVGGELALNWADNAEADVAGYHVYRSTDGTNFPKVASVAASAYTDTGLTDGTMYTYRVSAYDTSANESAHSEPTSATPTNTTAPGAPTGLTATAGDARVALDWADNTESDLAVYRVYRSSDGSPRALVATVSSSAFTDTGLTNGTSYTYDVTAVDTAGNESAASSTASATPKAVTITLTATSSKHKGTSEVRLTWSGTTASHVDVLRNGAVIATSVENTGAYTDRFKGGGTFTYRVCEAGTTTCSNDVTIST